MNREVEITEWDREETAYEKRIKFTYGGQEYSVKLSWSMYDGYDLDFLRGGDVIATPLRGGDVIATPEWAEDYENDDGEDLTTVLDGVTYYFEQPTETYIVETEESK
jgi:hypothetical protein